MPPGYNVPFFFHEPRNTEQPRALRASHALTPALTRILRQVPVPVARPYGVGHPVRPPPPRVRTRQAQPTRQPHQDMIMRPPAFMQLHDPHNRQPIPGPQPPGPHGLDERAHLPSFPLYVRAIRQGNHDGHPTHRPHRPRLDKPRGRQYGLTKAT